MILEISRLGLIHVAALISVAALTCRDQIVLRALLVASTLLYILYYFVVPAVLLWDAVFWTVVNLGVNLFMMAQLVLARTPFRLSDDERRLHAAFGAVSPGEFRALMKIAVWHRPQAAETLVREGAPVDHVYYILGGEALVLKGGRSLALPSPSFVGEIGFLRRVPATATVTVEAGALYVAWPAAALAALQARRPSIKTGLDSLLACDMAAKIAAA
ncbi:cyclic nucleotide-binding domain-containing protein [Labrys monachus]|uniref:CRP-like cAMP-binding protein n=1 Tax=Labrys monachus TaxID=217067 RepID=A0ABU0F8U1_9HYPH|nr:cyclic nucleotide-binding domain-containing protein [Labrys monachus]MDQ0391029.1 CRP-like cAMP-binding protein [Labrys monachus]